MESEFWAAIVGALVGSIGGGSVTWLLQRAQDNRQSSERNGALARSLVFKLLRIHSDFEGFRLDIVEAARNAEKNKLAVGWQSLRGIANFPARVSFTADEMSYLLSLKDFELLNDVMTLDVVHSSTIGIFEKYAARRAELTDMLPANMTGSIGEVSLTAAQHSIVAPRAAELDLLVHDMKSRVDRDAAESRDALVRTNRAIKQTLGYSLTLEFDGPKGASAAGSVA